jgi:hypothetical protein
MAALSASLKDKVVDFWRTSVAGLLPDGSGDAVKDIYHDGRVGLYTPTPQADFHIKRTAVAGGVTALIENTDSTASDYSELTMQNSAAVMTVGAYSAGGYGYIATNTPHKLLFGANNNTSLIIDINGNIGIGLTATANNPTDTLFIGSPTGGDSGLTFEGINAGTVATVGAAPLGVTATGKVVRYAVPTFDATVNFNTVTPTTGGVVFTPNTPASTTVIYVSSVDGSQWTYNGTTYVSAPASADWKTTGNVGTTPANNFIGTTDNVGLSIRTNNAIRQTVTAAGDVGVNTITPISKFDVNGGGLFGVQKSPLDAAMSVGANILNAAAPTKITTQAVTTPETAMRLISAGTSGIKYNTSADFQLGTYATGINAQTKLNIRLGNGNTHTPDTDVMTLQGNGNVGIGTTTPTSKLEVRTTGSTVAQLDIASSNENVDSVLSLSTPFQFSLNTRKTAIVAKALTNWSRADLHFVLNSNTDTGSFSAGADTKAIIKNDGSFGIGTTAPTQKLHVIGNILASGTITPSDKRLKSNIKDVTYGVKDLLKLKPISYTKKFSLDKAEKGEVKEFGFIAQDLQKVMPELVVEGTDKDKILAVSYTSLIPVLIKAIQEQQQQIEALKAKMK